MVVLSGQLPGLRHTTQSGEVYLGGNYIELGILPYGKFGASSKPAGFFGRISNSGIGMVGDADGFGYGTDLRIDYFLPGSPEEGFYFGFKVSGTDTYSKNSASSVTDTSSGSVASARIIAELTDLGGSLRVTQDVTLGVDDKLFKNEVLLENVGSIPISEVRFMRSHDPDNTVDYGGDYTTINTIVRSMSDGDSNTVVTASSFAGDDYYTAAGNKEALILYATSDPRGRGSYGCCDLAPYGLYDPNVWTSAPAKGSSNEADAYISITFEVGTLAPGESTTLVYYTVLDNANLDDILNNLACLEVVPNCIECDSVECFTCSPGYYLEANACLPCPGTGCSVCTATECSECFSGYHIDGTACTECSTTFDNCAECTPSECTLCSSGYYAESGACAECSTAFSECNECTPTECTGCVDGYLAVSGTCEECSDAISNCELCSEASGCTGCVDGYLHYYGYCYTCDLFFGTGCESCDYSSYCTSCSSGYYSYYGYCYSCPSDCSTCYNYYSCAVCDAGFYVNGSGGCSECSTTFSDCSECTSTGCTVCDVGYHVNASGGCTDCSTTFTGCSECTTTECTICDVGYYLNGGSCTRCTSTFPNCAECTSSACTLCKNTHELVGGLCKKLFSQPKLKAHWSIYKPGCIKWDISVPLETTADLTLEYGESFNKSMLLKSALAMKTAGSWSWTPHGIYKSMGRLKATFSDHTVYSEEFYIENPTSNYSLPC